MAKTNTSRRQSGRRVAILVDRSRDVQAVRGLIGLEPDDRYHTTDSRAPLTARRLAAHDVLVIAGHSPATYSRRETDAIVAFVRRGGGLLRRWGKLTRQQQARARKDPHPALRHAAG